MRHGACAGGLPHLTGVPHLHVNRLVCMNQQAPVVRKVDNSIHWINLYPVDNAIDFPNTYPLDSDLSGG